eukprot:7313537-Pyramimonas_sp.AAC.1
MGPASWSANFGMRRVIPKFADQLTAPTNGVEVGHRAPAYSAGHPCSCRYVKPLISTAKSKETTLQDNEAGKRTGNLDRKVSRTIKQDIKQHT